jgi:hypothetical protein
VARRNQPLHNGFAGGLTATLFVSIIEWFKANRPGAEKAAETRRKRRQVVNKKEFLLHLIGEMSNFFLEGNPAKMVISLHKEPDGLHLRFSTITNGPPKSWIWYDPPQQQPKTGTGGYYGNLAGFDFLGGARLDLVGLADQTRGCGSIDRGTRIDLWLGGSGFDPTNFSIPDLSAARFG